MILMLILMLMTTVESVSFAVVAGVFVAGVFVVGVGVCCVLGKTTLQLEYFSSRW